MRSYCVKQKKETLCIPGSERITTAKNGRHMSVCVCSECGITKTKFIAEKTGGAISKSDFSCGYDLKGKRAGTAEECFKKGQVRRWGVEKLDDGYIDVLLADRIIDRNMKAKAKRGTRKPTKTQVKDTISISEIPYANVRRPTKKEMKYMFTERPMSMNKYLKKIKKANAKEKAKAKATTKKPAKKSAIDDMFFERNKPSGRSRLGSL